MVEQAIFLCMFFTIGKFIRGVAKGCQYGPKTKNVLTINKNMTLFRKNFYIRKLLPQIFSRFSNILDEIRLFAEKNANFV